MRRIFHELNLLLIIIAISDTKATVNYDLHGFGAVSGADSLLVIQERKGLNIPNYLKPCSRRTKKFNICLRSAIQTFFNGVTKGDKELGIPSTDPLNIYHLEISEGTGDVSLNMDFKDFTIYGLGNAKVISTRSNLEDYKFELTVKYPFLNMTGVYNSSGGVLTFPIVGKGDFYFNLSDVSTAWIMYLSESDRINNKTYFLIDSFTIEIIPADISIHLGDEIDDDKNLGTVFNTFFNENVQEIFKYTKPKISDALSSIFSKIASRVFSLFPVETLLPP